LTITGRGIGSVRKNISADEKKQLRDKKPFSISLSAFGNFAFFKKFSKGCLWTDDNQADGDKAVKQKPESERYFKGKPSWQLLILTLCR